VIQIMRLHMDAVKAFGAQEPGTEAEWTEEDEAEVADIIKEVNELEDPEDPDGFSNEEDAGEDQPEDSEET
jgi:hypothetical protein